MSSRLIVFCISLLLLIGLLGGYAPTLAGVDVPQIVTAGLGRDPGVMYGYGAHPPLTRVLEPLVFRDPEQGLIPGLATGWSTSADSLTWNIYLREGVTFHDGTPFDGAAVVENIWRVAEMSPGRFGSLKTVEAVSEHKVKVTHSEPFASFLFALAWPGAAMISPQAFDDEGKVLEPVGTGPFIRDSWVPGAEMVLVRNERYWGGQPLLEKVILKFIQDPTTRMMALEAGEIDMIIDTGGVLPEQVPTLKRHPQIEVLTVAGAVPHYMTLNTRAWPFDDERVRRAIVYAIDPNSIVQYALEGYGKVMTSVVPFSEREWLHPERLFTYNNPQKARELLRDAGWQAGNDGILEKNGKKFQVRLLLSSAMVARWPHQPIAEAIQAQLGEVGISTTIEIQEAGLWRETLQKGEANLGIRPWAAVCPQSRLHVWLHAAGEQNLAMGIFYDNPRINDLTENLLRTIDKDEARKIALEIQEIVAREVPVIPLYDEILINAVRKNIKGYKIDPRFNVNWEDIYVTE